MNDRNPRLIAWTGAIASFFFILSFLGWHWPFLNAIFAGIITLCIVYLYFKHPEIAFGLLFAELAMGGKGWWLSVQIGDTILPIRILIFTVVFLSWLGSALMQLRNGSSIFKIVKNIPAGIRSALIILGLSIVWGMGWGLVRGNGFGAVFFDANAWMYFLLLLPLLSLAAEGKGELLLTRTVAFIIGAGLVNALLTLVLFHVFDHQYNFTLTLYQWTRDAQFGEVTFIRPGAWRVFLQSQVWLLFVAAWFFLTGIAKSQQNKIVHISLLSVTLSALFISFSRSNWIGLIAAGITGVTLLLYHRTAPAKRILAVTAGGILGGMLLMIAFQRIPPIPAGGIPLRERLSIEEAGSSRMNQLIPLLKAIAKYPVIGSGFGTAVTYISADPRIVARSPGGSGEYTTSAFEWGYLDIWLKIGFVGLVSYLWLIAVIGKKLWDMMEQTEIPTLAATLLLALVGISTVNITSPYLNHPLGIGLVILCFVVAIKKQFNAVMS